MVNDHRGSQYPISFDGRFSHAVLKWAKAGDFRVQEEFGSRTEAAVALPRLIEEVTHIVRLLVESLLFARLDSIEVHRWLWLTGLERSNRSSSSAMTGKPRNGSRMQSSYYAETER